MLPRGSFRPRHGFTTIEALIAAVVFLLGLSGLLGALTQARNATGQARRYMQATDIANDLVEQMQLWDINDKRLGRLATGDCKSDPQDKAGALLQSDKSAAFLGYAGCLQGETELTAERWGGLKDPAYKFPSFTDEQGNRTEYMRFFSIHEQQVRAGVKRLQIWVKVRYEDASGVHVVTAQTMRIRMGT